MLKLEFEEIELCRKGESEKKRELGRYRESRARSKCPGRALTTPLPTWAGALLTPSPSHTPQRGEREGGKKEKG